MAAGEIADSVGSRGRSRHGYPLCRRAGQRGADRAAEGAAGILRSEITDPAGVTALNDVERDLGIGHPDRQGRFQEGNTPRDALFPPSFP